jgi:Integrase zinc binding domain
VIADAMSRICINNKPEVPAAILAAINGPYVINNDNYKITESVHNATVGHGGVERTLRKLQDLKLTWKNMRLDVKTYIRECPCCQKMSQIKIPVTAYKYKTSTYRPMECLNIEFIGPYPDKGYVLNIIDDLCSTPYSLPWSGCRRSDHPPRCSDPYPRALVECTRKLARSGHTPMHKLGRPYGTPYP